MCGIKLVSRNYMFLFPTLLSCPHHSLVLGDALCPASNLEFQVCNLSVSLQVNTRWKGDRPLMLINYYQINSSLDYSFPNRFSRLRFFREQRPRQLASDNHKAEDD